MAHAVNLRESSASPSPDTCKFTVSRAVHPGGAFFFANKERAAGSPVVERLFALTGVQSVLIAKSVVTVGKEPGISWSGLKAGIGAAIRTQLLTGVPAILEAQRNASTGGRTAEEVRAALAIGHGSFLASGF